MPGAKGTQVSTEETYMYIQYVLEQRDDLIISVTTLSHCDGERVKNNLRMSSIISATVVDSYYQLTSSSLVFVRNVL